MAERAVHLLISGYVQGVGYRHWATQTARKLGVRGWVRNLYDGRVELYAEGESAAIDALVKHCNGGPMHASVKAVDVEEVTIQGAKGFDSRSTSDKVEQLS
jgi:acylphosphatase